MPKPHVHMRHESRCTGQVGGSGQDSVKTRAQARDREVRVRCVSPASPRLASHASLTARGTTDVAGRRGGDEVRAQEGTSKAASSPRLSRGRARTAAERGGSLIRVRARARGRRSSACVLAVAIAPGLQHTLDHALDAPPTLRHSQHESWIFLHARPYLAVSSSCARSSPPASPFTIDTSS